MQNDSQKRDFPYFSGYSNLKSGLKGSGNQLPQWEHPVSDAQLNGVHGNNSEILLWGGSRYLPGSGPSIILIFYMIIFQPSTSIMSNKSRILIITNDCTDGHQIFVPGNPSCARITQLA